MLVSSLTKWASARVQLTDINIVLCWSADGQHLAIYSNEEFYKKTLLPVTLKITVAWGWSMFFANSLMTGGIIYKIMYRDLFFGRGRL
jgi:hypothetical protein